MKFLKLGTVYQLSFPFIQAVQVNSKIDPILPDFFFSVLLLLVVICKQKDGCSVFFALLIMVIVFNQGATNRLLNILSDFIKPNDWFIRCLLVATLSKDEFDIVSITQLNC